MSGKIIALKSTPKTAAILHRTNKEQIVLRTFSDETKIAKLEQIAIL